MIEPPPQIPTFNYIWQKWFGNLYNDLFEPEIIVVEDSDMSNSWVASDATRQPRYWKDGFNVVHLSGRIKSGSLNADIFTFPTGYIPDFIDASGAYVAFPVTSNQLFGQVSISYLGVLKGPAGDNTWVSLDGITFKAI